MTILTRGRHKQRPFAFWTYVFNSEHLWIHKETGCKQFLRIYCKRTFLSCFFLFSLTRTPDNRLSHHPPPRRDGSLLYPNSSLLSISGWGVWEWGPRSHPEMEFKKGKTYLKLNIVISVACLWISLKLHRCISTSLGRRSKNKVICTIL